MVETGARFNDNFYIKIAIDPEDTTETAVTLETTVDGVTEVMTGTVTWDE